MMVNFANTLAKNGFYGSFALLLFIWVIGINYVLVFVLIQSKPTYCTPASYDNLCEDICGHQNIHFSRYI